MLKENNKFMYFDGATEVVTMTTQSQTNITLHI